MSAHAAVLEAAAWALITYPVGEAEAPVYGRRRDRLGTRAGSRRDPAVTGLIASGSPRLCGYVTGGSAGPAVPGGSCDTIGGTGHVMPGGGHCCCVRRRNESGGW